MVNASQTTAVTTIGARLRAAAQATHHPSSTTRGMLSQAAPTFQRAWEEMISTAANSRSNAARDNFELANYSDDIQQRRRNSSAWRPGGIGYCPIVAAEMAMGSALFDDASPVLISHLRQGEAVPVNTSTARDPRSNTIVNRTTRMLNQRVAEPSSESIPTHIWATNTPPTPALQPRSSVRQLSTSVVRSQISQDNDRIMDAYNSMLSRPARGNALNETENPMTRIDRYQRRAMEMNRIEVRRLAGNSRPGSDRTWEEDDLTRPLLPHRTVTNPTIRRVGDFSSDVTNQASRNRYRRPSPDQSPPPLVAINDREQTGTRVSQEAPSSSEFVPLTQSQLIRAMMGIGSNSASNEPTASVSPTASSDTGDQISLDSDRDEDGIFHPRDRLVLRRRQVNRRLQVNSGTTVTVNPSNTRAITPPSQYLPRQTVRSAASPRTHISRAGEVNPAVSAVSPWRMGFSAEYDPILGSRTSATEILDAEARRHEIRRMFLFNTRSPVTAALDGDIEMDIDSVDTSVRAVGRNGGPLC